MQCVRCQHPLPPRADRCLRCFALNPQNRPEPLAAATPAVPLGSVQLVPLKLSFESDPPPQSGGIGAMSIRSEPPAPKPAAPKPAAPKRPLESGPGDPVFIEAGPTFTPIDDPEFSFAEPGLASPPRLVIDLGQSAPPPAPDTLPSPPPSGMEPAPPPRPAISASSKATEPQLTPAPFIDLPPAPAIAPARPPAPGAALRSIDKLAQMALQLSDPDLPLAAPPSNPERAEESPDLAGLSRPARPSLGARLGAWAFDGAAIALVSLLFVGLAALQLGGRKLAPLGAQSWQSWADGLLFAHRLPIFWGLLAATLALGYSWLFAALGGRTPGLRLAGLELRREDGSPLDPVQALWRALLALPSAALGLFGFLLALFDPRGQTLHDKLSRSLLVVSDGARRGSGQVSST